MLCFPMARMAPIFWGRCLRSKVGVIAVLAVSVEIVHGWLLVMSVLWMEVVVVMVVSKKVVVVLGGGRNREGIDGEAGFL